MNTAINGYLYKPYFHVIVFLVISFAALLLIRPKDANAAYTMAGVLYGIFIVTNSILVIFVSDTWSYFFTSLLFSVIYVLAVAVIASLYMQLAKIEGSGESAMVFLIILYHPLAMLFIIFVKWTISKL